MCTFEAVIFSDVQRGLMFPNVFYTLHCVIDFSVYCEMSAGLPKGLMHCCLSGRLENSLLTRLRVSLHTLEFIMKGKLALRL